MDETIVSDRQEDEKQNKIVHLLEEPHSHTGISEAHNPHCETNIYLKSGGGGAAVEKKNVPFAATKHIQSGETSENRSGAQENSQTSNYTSDTIIVQNRGTIRSDRGSNCMMSNNGIPQDDINDALKVDNRWRTMPVKFYGEWTSFNQILDRFMARKEAGMYYWYKEGMEKIYEGMHNAGKIDDSVYETIKTTIEKCSEKYRKYYSKVFDNRLPRDGYPSEKRMWEELGCPMPKNRAGEQNSGDKMDYNNGEEKTQNNHLVRSDRTTNHSSVKMPTLEEFSKKYKNYDEMCEAIRKWAEENKNIPDKKKEWFNVNVCGAACIGYAYQL